MIKTSYPAHKHKTNLNERYRVLKTKLSTSQNLSRMHKTVIIKPRKKSIYRVNESFNISPSRTFLITGKFFTLDWMYNLESKSWTGSNLTVKYVLKDFRGYKILIEISLCQSTVLIFGWGGCKVKVKQSINKGKNSIVFLVEITICSRLRLHII
jgi:hypothetical protein